MPNNIIPANEQTRREKARRTTMLRGVSDLEAEGYRFESVPNHPAIYDAYPPDGRGPYRVDVVKQTCTCPAWRSHGCCKHLIHCSLRVMQVALPALLGASIAVVACQDSSGNYTGRTMFWDSAVTLSRRALDRVASWPRRRGAKEGANA